MNVVNSFFLRSFPGEDEKNSEANVLNVQTFTKIYKRDKQWSEVKLLKAKDLTYKYTCSVFFLFVYYSCATKKLNATFGETERKQASTTTVTKSETVAKALGKAISFWLPDWRLHYIIQILFDQICQHTYSYSANMSKIKWFEELSVEYSNSWSLLNTKLLVMPFEKRLEEINIKIHWTETVETRVCKFCVSSLLINGPSCLSICVTVSNPS